MLSSAKLITSSFVSPGILTAANRSRVSLWTRIVVMSLAMRISDMRNIVTYT